MIRVVLFDLDGVIRHFDASYVADIERRHGLAAGTLDDIAYAKPLIEDVTTGRISRMDWVRQIGELAANPAAAAEWGVQPAVVDAALLHLSDELRAAGLTTALLTNGTDTIPAEIDSLGIGDRFDAIFNSAAIGYVKPDIRAFEYVLRALGVKAEEVFFTDDSASKLTGAAILSMRTHLFDDVEGLRRHLVEAGVDIGR
jgi:putative hydrolase of the HAD superfamily